MRNCNGSPNRANSSSRSARPRTRSAFATSFHCSRRAVGAALMTKASSTDWEIAIALPLGVVASQLARIEEQLRLLNLKAADLVKERDGGRRNGAIAVRLENINGAVDSIRPFMSDLEAEIDPPRRSSDGIFSSAPARKPYPDRDD